MEIVVGPLQKTFLPAGVETLLGFTKHSIERDPETTSKLRGIAFMQRHGIGIKMSTYMAAMPPYLYISPGPLSCPGCVKYPEAGGT